MNNTDTGTHFKDAHKIAFKIRTYYRTKLSTLTNKLTYMHNAHAHDQHSRTCEHFPLLAAALISTWFIYKMKLSKNVKYSKLEFSRLDTTVYLLGSFGS